MSPLLANLAAITVIAVHCGEELEGDEGEGEYRQTRRLMSIS